MRRGALHATLAYAFESEHWIDQRVAFRPSTRGAWTWDQFRTIDEGEAYVTVEAQTAATELDGMKDMHCHVHLEIQIEPERSSQA